MTDQASGPSVTPTARTIILTGGGSGGHITPLLAVAHELKKLEPRSRIIYVGERHGKFAHLTKGQTDIDEIHTVFAGKFRRYHGESWLTRVTAVKTNLLNLRDAVFVGIGFLQSLALLRRLKPNVILLKGGYVGVPIGLAAVVGKRPFVTHDSDALPGLANRLVSRWARVHATGMPAEYYNYPRNTVRHIGVLVVEDYRPVTPPMQKQYRIDLGVSPASKVLLITGGSLGARSLNLAMVKIAPELLQQFSDLHIIHQVGKGNSKTYGEYTHHRLQVLEFLKPLATYTGAADIVVTRAGANTLAELGVQGKACIVVPNPLLTGGHQLKNAEYLSQHKAVEVVDEAKVNRNPEFLQTAIQELLQDSLKRQALGATLRKLTVPDAAQRLALILLETGTQQTG